MTPDTASASAFDTEDRDPVQPYLVLRFPAARIVSVSPSAARTTLPTSVSA